jgi:Omptin family
MPLSRVLTLIVVGWIALLSPGLGVCQIVFDPAGATSRDYFPSNQLPVEQGYKISGEIRKYFNSFTSYQFPNPFPPGQDPLSRLEFPIDQWFLGLSSSYQAPHWALIFSGSTNLNRVASVKMQDSDWDDENMPFRKNIFSESKCRLNRGLLADIRAELKPALRLPCRLRPIIGYRYQYFFFTTFDGEQWELSGGSMDLPGDGIDFEQTFYHFYFGGILEADFSLEYLFRGLGRTRVAVQADYALVTARNEDLHLLRMGERITTENTAGHCWHVGANALMYTLNGIELLFEVDFKRIVTNGDHKLTNDIFAVDFSFSGSKVWSDQFTLSATGRATF